MASPNRALHLNSVNRKPATSLLLVPIVIMAAIGSVLAQEARDAPNVVLAQAQSVSSVDSLVQTARKKSAALSPAGRKQVEGVAPAFC